MKCKKLITLQAAGRYILRERKNVNGGQHLLRSILKFMFVSEKYLLQIKSDLNHSL